MSLIKAREFLQAAELCFERSHFIHTFVYEPEQQIEEALRQKAEAERVLAEAKGYYSGHNGLKTLM